MAAVFSTLARGMVAIAAAILFVAVTWTMYIKRDAVIAAGAPIVDWFAPAGEEPPAPATTANDPAAARTPVATTSTTPQTGSESAAPEAAPQTRTTGTTAEERPAAATTAAPQTSSEDALRDAAPQTGAPGDGATAPDTQAGSEAAALDAARQARTGGKSAAPASPPAATAAPVKEN